MEKTAANERKPHCLILPFPVQGHINPMLQFSKRLVDKGITVTVAATKSLLNSTDDFPASISVETISDGYDQGRGDESIPEYQEKFQRVGKETLSQLLEKLRQSGRPVDCVIYDPFLPWALAVARSLGVFGAAFFTQSCSVNVIYYSIYKGLLRVPLPALEKEILMPGLPPLEVSDLPTFVRDQDQFPGALKVMVDQFQGIEDADFVFVSSVYELEEEATEWLKKELPVMTIGPTIPSIYLDNRLAQDKNYGLSMFKPVDSCMKWLDQRSPKSVIYVSFGSMAELEEQQMEELARSLESTDKHFLWVVRSSEESKIPRDFADDKGLIVSWCPQLEVLAHNAIGCFLTHCGWNSTLEALCLGVPMVVVPWWSDQSTNAKLVMDVWKMGIRAYSDGESIVRHEEIVRCVKLVMEGERGEEMIENARKWKEVARAAVDEGGSSDKNIQKFVSSMMTTPQV